jgi:hypothetical protein
MRLWPQYDAGEDEFLYLVPLLQPAEFRLATDHEKKARGKRSPMVVFPLYCPYQQRVARFPHVTREA